MMWMDVKGKEETPKIPIELAKTRQPTGLQRSGVKGEFNCMDQMLNNRDKCGQSKIWWLF